MYFCYHFIILLRNISLKISNTLWISHWKNIFFYLSYSHWLCLRSYAQRLPIVNSIFKLSIWTEHSDWTFKNKAVNKRKHLLKLFFLGSKRVNLEIFFQNFSVLNPNMPLHVASKCNNSKPFLSLSTFTQINS